MRPRPRSPKRPPISWHGTRTRPWARWRRPPAWPAGRSTKAERHLTQANLAAVPVTEGLARVVRALVALGDDFLVLGRQRLLSGQDIPAFSAVVALLERGRQAGDLRSDLPLSCQVEALYALVDACLRASELAATGPEDISATALRLFLEGSQPPPARPPR